MSEVSEKCIVCGKACEDWHFMGDHTDINTVWCPECFDKTPCGRGEHGEGCPTQVMKGEE